MAASDVRASPGAGSAPASGAVLLTSLEALAPFESEWRELALARSSLLATPEFYKAWAHNFAASFAPYVPALLDEQGRLRGLLPLVISRDAWRHVQVPGAADFWAHVRPVAPADAEQEVVLACADLLAQRFGEWRQLTLQNAVSDHGWAEVLAEAVREGTRRKLHERRTPHPWLVVEVAEGWDAYLATRPAKFRHELRRLRRRLESAHRVEVRQTLLRTELRDDLEALLELHRARRRELGGSTFDERAMRGVISELASEAFDRQWLRLRLTEVDGVVVGGSLCLRIGSRWECHLLGWNPAWAPYGLGRTIAMDVAEAAAHEGARELDLGVGSSDFKRRIATLHSQVVTVSLYPLELALLFSLRRAARRTLPKRLRRLAGRTLRLGDL